MESSRLFHIMLSGLLWVVFFWKVVSARPAFTAKPNKPLIGFQGEAVNFTWKYSNHSVNEIYFGTYSEDYMTIDNTLLTIKRHSNGTVEVLSEKSQDTAPYAGRLRWVGDVSKNIVIFQLYPLRISDEKQYGIEADFGDFEIVDNTKLIVKMPSIFTFGLGYLSLLRGQSASFAWRYTLNDDDKKSLSSITFGAYKHGRYEALCVVQVKNEHVVKLNCSTGMRKTNAQNTVITPTSTATFLLNQIGLEDEAVYSIRLGGTLRNMENKTNLVVTVPPKILEQPKSTTIIEGQMLNLSCVAHGKPRPLIRWIKDGKVLQENFTEQYIIGSIAKEDAGKYHCVAENGVGKARSTYNAIVDVQYAPIINVSSKVLIVHVPIGRGVWLRCPSIANPVANTQWLSNGIVEKSGTDEFYVFIRDNYDYANYTCKASNPIGKDNATFVLQKVGPPSTPRVDCEKRDDTRLSRVAMFHWRAPEDDGGAPVLAYTVKHRILKRQIQSRELWKNENVTHTTTWHKFTLQWQSTFEFSVTAWNIYGESKNDLDNSCIVTIGKEPETIKEGPTTKPTKSLVAAAARKDSISKSSTSNVMIYIGPCIALAVVVAIVAIMIRRRMKKNRANDPKWDERHFSFGNALSLEGNIWGEASANDKLLGSRSRKQSMVGSPCYQMDPDWIIPREKICILKVIGNGAFGLVYKGRVHGKGTNTVGWSLVAIKSPYADATDAEVRDLMKEFELLKTLKPHPHVIKLLGCAEDEGRPLVIIEYVPFGDLLGYLRKSRGENDDYYSDPEIKPNTNLSSQQLLRFGWHVADGMAYLASEKIIHRDLAARNVLVGEGLSCKVTDFGMAKDVSNDDIYVRTTEGRLPVKWTAIEAMTGSGEYTTKSDVWSFGVVLYEICTIGAEPYPGLNGKEIPQRLDEGYRMPRPGHVDPDLYEIMMSCWNTEPEERPTFPELKENLLKLEEVQSRDYINLSECLYQNVGANGQVKGKRKSPLGSIGRAGSSKGAAKGNAYHAGPGIAGSSVGTEV